MRKRTAILGAAAVILAGALALAVLHGPERPQSASRGSSAPVAAFRVGTVELRELPEVYAADAVIEAVRSATVSAQIAGNVTRYYVDAGDRVKRGQILVRIDPRETDAQVAAGAARVAQAEAQLGQAKLNYQRTAKLVDQKFVSQAAFDKAQADLKSAQADLQLARASATQAATARSFAEVRSPLDGVVTRRLAELGELAAPGKPLLEVHDPSALRAVASVPQFALSKLSQASAADVAFAAQEAPVKAIRVTVLPAADARLLSTQVRADLPASLPAGVVPGTAAKVLLPIGRTQRLVMPAAAVVRRGEVTGAYVVGSDGAARLRQIRVGESEGAGTVEVLAGLDAGERVTLPAAASLP
jgi:RND family efflux transporter MFP subunit